MQAFRALSAVLATLALGACGFSEETFRQPPPQAAPALAAPGSAAPALAPPAAETRKPFVVIHFEQPDPDFASSLFEALQSALKRKPSVAFDLVAVTRDPDAAERNLTRVFRSMTEMGLPPDRVSLAAVAAKDEATDEVWIYVR